MNIIIIRMLSSASVENFRAPVSQRFLMHCSSFEVLKF